MCHMGLHNILPCCSTLMHPPGSGGSSSRSIGRRHSTSRSHRVAWHHIRRGHRRRGETGTANTGMLGLFVEITFLYRSNTIQQVAEHTHLGDLLASIRCLDNRQYKWCNWSCWLHNQQRAYVAARSLKCKYFNL